MATEIKVNINAKGVLTGGKEVEGGLQKIRHQAKQTQSDLQKAMKVDVRAQLPQLNQFAGGLSNIASGFSALRVAGPIGIGLAIFGKAALAAADSSEKLNNSLLGLQTVSRNTGNDIGLTTQIAKNLSRDGLIPLEDAAAALKNLLATGLDAEKAGKLLFALKDAAAFNRAGFLSMGEAVKTATEGIKNGNSILVDNAGVTRNLSLMQKDYAASIGTTIGKLTDAQKIQAAYVGILKEAEKFTGDAAKAADTYTGAKARLSTVIERTTANLGNFITQSSLVKGAINLISDGIENLSFVSLSADEKIKILTKDLAEFDKRNQFNTRAKGDKNRLIQEIASLKEIAELEKLRGAQSEHDAKLKRQEIEDIKALEDTKLKAAEAEKKRLEEIKKLKKQLIDAGKTELESLKDLRDRRLAIAKGDAEAQRLIWADYYEKKKKLDEKSSKDSNKLAKDSLKEIIDMQKIARDVMQDFAANPLGGSNTLRDLKSARDELIKLKGDNESEELFGRIKDLDGKIAAGESGRSFGVGAGIANSIVGGANGARSLVSGAAAAGLDAYMPGLGQAAKPLLDAFAQGPDAVKAMVNEFADALPDVIIGFVEAIPVFIETLVDRAPDIIDRLVQRAPAIIGKLVADAPRLISKVTTLMPKIAFEFAKEFIKNVPKIVGEIARAVYDAISDTLSGAGGAFGSGGGVSSWGEDANDWSKENLGIGFAKGGEVPSFMGTPFRDSISARLMGGERVLDRGTNSAFKKFVNEGGTSTSDVLLARIIQLLENPMTVSSSLKVDNKAFADILLQLSRTNQRTV